MGRFGRFSTDAEKMIGRLKRDPKYKWGKCPYEYGYWDHDNNEWIELTREEYNHFSENGHDFFRWRKKEMDKVNMAEFRRCETKWLKKLGDWIEAKFSWLGVVFAVLIWAWTIWLIISSLVYMYTNYR